MIRMVVVHAFATLGFEVQFHASQFTRVVVGAQLESVEAVVAEHGGHLGADLAPGHNVVNGAVDGASRRRPLKASSGDWCPLDLGVRKVHRPFPRVNAGRRRGWQGGRAWRSCGYIHAATGRLPVASLVGAKNPHSSVLMATFGQRGRFE